MTLCVCYGLTERTLVTGTAVQSPRLPEKTETLCSFIAVYVRLLGSAEVPIILFTSRLPAIKLRRGVPDITNQLDVRLTHILRPTLPPA